MGQALSRWYLRMDAIWYAAPCIELTRCFRVTGTLPLLESYSIFSMCQKSPRGSQVSTAIIIMRSPASTPYREWSSTPEARIAMCACRVAVCTLKPRFIVTVASGWHESESGYKVAAPAKALCRWGQRYQRGRSERPNTWRSHQPPGCFRRLPK